MKQYLIIIFISFLGINSAKSQSDVFGQFLSFNGGVVTNNGQYVEILDNPSLDFNATQSFTIQFWVNPKTFETKAGDVHGLVTKKTTSGMGYAVNWEVNSTGGRYIFRVRDAGNTKTIFSDYIANINTTGWTHITAIMQRDANGTADSLFLNINAQNVAKGETSVIGDVSNSQNLYFMREASTSNNSAGGFLDEVRIWNVALTEKQIDRLYFEPILENLALLVSGEVSSRTTSLTWSSLAGYWNMSDLSTGFSVADFSNNTNNGVFYEGPTACSVALCGPTFEGQSVEPQATYVTFADGPWSLAATWAGSQVPNSNRAGVFVNSGHTVTLDGSFDCNDLVVESGGTLISSSGATLNIYQNFDIDGTFDDNFGTIQFIGNGNHNVNGNSGIIDFFDFVANLSNSQIQVNSPIVISGVLYHTNGRIRTENNLTLSGSTGNPNRPYGLIAPGGNPDIVGNITMEKTLSNTNAGWRQLCMPLAGTVAGFSGLTLNTSTSVNAADPNIYYWDNAQNGATPDNVGWTQASDNDNETKALTVNLINPDYPFTVDFSFTGAYNPGDKNFTLTYFNDPGNPLSSGNVGYENGVGWNFIPNNYPSLLNTGTMLTENPLNYQSIHIWDAINQQYKAYSSAFNNIVPYNNVGSGAFISNQAMVPFQGYWVKTDNTENGFNYILKDTWRSTVFTLSPYASLKNINAAQIDVLSANDSTWDAVAVSFDAGASPDFEPDKDVYKIISPSNVPSLFIEADKRFLQISTVPNIAQSMPLHFKPNPAKPNGIYYISLNAFQLNRAWSVVLEDKAMKTKHDLRKSPYAFNAAFYSSSDRFVLHFSKNKKVPTLVNNVYAYTTTDEIIVVSNGLNGLATLELFTLDGKTLFENKVQLGGENRIPLPATSGIVYLRVRQNSGIYTIKVPMIR